MPAMNATSSHPLESAASRILKPTRSHTPRTISAIVAIQPTSGINAAGNQGFNCATKSGNVPDTVDALHRAVLQGKSDMSERLTRIERQLEQILGQLAGRRPPAASVAIPTDVLEERIVRALRDE